MARRLAGKENPKLSTGGIEVRARDLVVYNATPTPPFEMHGPEPNEELRLTYRYLDLRRPAMHEIFILRHRLAQLMRRTMSESRVSRGRDADPGSQHAGRRARLPGRQPAPSRPFLRAAAVAAIYKQLLMVSGFDRYFQIARCFRDEDLRANRQPEFTQLDVEMSFVDDHDVTSTMEILVAAMAREFGGRELELPLPRLEYHDVMERFGSDRPDLRYGLELKDVADIAESDRVQGLSAGHRARPSDPRDLRARRWRTTTAAKTSTG